MHWILTGHLPKIEAKGKYKADGQVLILPVQGDGDGTIVLRKNIQMLLVILMMIRSILWIIK